MPHRNPEPTGVVWNPWNVASRTTSRHHIIIVRERQISPSSRIAMVNPCIHLANPTVKKNAPHEAVRGHGLNSTKWNGIRVIKYKGATAHK